MQRRTGDGGERGYGVSALGFIRSRRDYGQDKAVRTAAAYDTRMRFQLDTTTPGAIASGLTNIEIGGVTKLDPPTPPSQ